MSLTDVVSASGTVGFAQIGFIISFVVFTLIVIWALLRPKSAMEAEARSVLTDAPTVDTLNPPKEPRHGQH